MKPSWKSSSSGPRIALTSGEPAGIGPDLCLALSRMELPCELVCLADPQLLAERAAALGLAATLHPYDPERRARHDGAGLSVLACPLAVPARAGALDPRNASAVLAMLDRAVAGCVSGEFDALVTAPVQKSVMNDAGIAFSGHTEYLAARTGAAQPVMLLAAGALRVALATTHLPLKAVSETLTSPLLITVLRTLAHDLARYWRLERPCIAVCGLNPHAGERGYLGREELEVIGPAIEQVRGEGIEASGPYPADTLFVPQQLARFDAVLAMYHDQGLPVVKHACFDSAVNVTLGLPIVRTSVDHGTALELAGTGRADAGSLIAAVRLAIELAAA
jgi:4-hydroxythreonine-4-phosphate dehydrogenase